MLIVTLILTECLILWQAIYVTTGLSQLGQESHSQGKKLKTAVHAVPNMMTVTEIEHDVERAIKGRPPSMVGHLLWEYQGTKVDLDYINTKPTH